jgi:hypothetical protein
MISESAADSMTLALISSEGGSVGGSTLDEAHTVTSKARNYINGSLTHIIIVVFHSRNDFREYSSLDDFGPDII